VFLSILEILDHNTGYKDYEKIPLEFGIGTGKFDKWAKFDGRHLTCEDEAIKWLKTYIICYYHDWYKQKHNNESPMSTFIILTESAYRELEPLDKKICQKIEYKYKKDSGKEEVITFFAADVDRVQQRGRVFEFLEKIGYAGSKLYGRIDEVYVPPLEYEDMKRTLKEEKIVFITGTREYGKTYTAVRLMWKFYNSGYEPGWIKGGEPAERIEVRKRLENIRAELKPGHIIYFEDPFGKTKYERREGLEREIGTIIDTVKQVEDVYVIVTSREEVFKEFEKEKLSVKELGELEKKLNIKKPSYDDEKRKKILLNWAEEENCKWLGNKELKNFVLDYMWYEKILPTPLSIKDFAVATTEIEKEDELKEKIEEKSRETAKAFAEEIKNMSDDKILFLSFLFTRRRFEVDFVRATYQELMKELDLKDAWEFDRVLNWFEDDKISINYFGIDFSHPSYSEALPYLLVEDGYITQINKRIFSELLLKLAEKDAAAGEVACFVSDNFDKLPEDVRNKLLLKLAEKDAAAGEVACFVSDNFDKLPEDVRNKLLLKLAEKDAATGHIARAVADNFNTLPDAVRDELLLKLSEKDETAKAVAGVVARNFDELENLRDELLLKLSEKDTAARDVAWDVVRNFDELENVRDNLLLKLSEKDTAAWVVEWAVSHNFDKLPEDVRDELLLKLSGWVEVARDVAWDVARNFDELENVRDELLLKLSEKDTAAWHVAKAVARNFNKLPGNVRNLLGILQKPLQQVIEGLSKNKKRWGKEQALYLISNALPKIDMDFVLKILNDLSNCEDETVRIKAAKMLKDIFDDSISENNKNERKE
jgi:hypothetical protein